MEVDSSYRSQARNVTGHADAAEAVELERMATLPEINMHDQEGISYTLSTALCEDFHKFERAQDGSDEIFAESFDLCSQGVKALEGTIRSSGRRDPKVVSALKQLRSEVEAYRLVLLARNYEDQVEHAKDSSLLANACAHDDDTRQLMTLLRWSEQAAAEDPSGFADLCSQYDAFDKVANVKRDTTNAIARGNSVEIGVDFDGKSSGDDAVSIDRVYRVVFALVRCGKNEEARELLLKTGAASLAPLLSLRRVQEVFELTPLAQESPFSQMLQKRKLFKKTIAAILKKEGSTLSAPLRMLWAALAGRVEPLLSVANKTEDRIWVLANAAVEAKLDALAGGEVTCEAPGSVESVFGEVLPHESWPYFRIYSALLRSDARDAVQFSADFLADFEKSDKPVPEHLLRFMSHLVVIFRNTKKAHDTTLGNRIILKYSGKLLTLSLTHLIPYYVNFLNDATGKSVTMQTMYRLKSVQSRLSFLDALAAAGQNYRKLAKEVVIKSRLDESNSSPDLIDRFRWLLYKDRETETDAVVEACVLLRKFLESGDDVSVRQLLEVCATREGSLADRVRAHAAETASMLAPMVRRACAEYTEFVYYLNGIDAFDAWRQAHGERINERRKDSTRSIADTTTASSMIFSAEAAIESKRAGERADRLRATESMLSGKGVSVLDMFLRHEGWRTREADEEYEEERARSLRVLRDRYFSSALLRMAQMLAESGEERVALETAALVHSLRLYEDISKEKLRTFLQYIHKVTGSTIN
ncbi:hypothetical protein PMAYCL1PPCAC_03719 [Pristionchus mayeri]|uniref:Nuclear pore complex protein n=1 Tax=Pristionchus mayeri TaxID=1317129 RepID=A0AAN4Z5I4_9BILA|nr:hypothetical protein PMAYCL1PPCAC_03719 [Pristionchus mayeri]